MSILDLPILLRLCDLLEIAGVLVGELLVVSLCWGPGELLVTVLGVTLVSSQMTVSALWDLSRVSVDLVRSPTDTALSSGSAG